jgi:hypothetical protein
VHDVFENIEEWATLGPANKARHWDEFALHMRRRAEHEGGPVDCHSWGEQLDYWIGRCAGAGVNGSGKATPKAAALRKVATAGGRKAPAVPRATVSDDAKMSVAELSKAFGVPAEALRKRLERLRRRDFTCFAEVPNPARKQPTFLYHVGKVRAVIEALNASVKASAKRPT